MKKIITILFIIILMFTALKVFASSSKTKKEAIAKIEKALEDPEISAWVINKYRSKEIFLKAVKLAPEKTVKEIETAFYDFLESGGDLERAAETAIWVWIIIAIAGIGLTAIAIASS